MIDRVHNGYLRMQMRWGKLERVIVTSNWAMQIAIVDKPDKRDRRNRLHKIADGLIWNLWIDDYLRGEDYGNKLLEEAEQAAREMGCKTIALEWSRFESPEWVLQWYLRHGYKEYGFNDYSTMLTKKL